MRELYELLACPQHGLLRPANWQAIVVASSDLRMYYFSLHQAIRSLIQRLK